MGDINTLLEMQVSNIFSRSMGCLSLSLVPLDVQKLLLLFPKFNEAQFLSFPFAVRVSGITAKRSFPAQAPEGRVPPRCFFKVVEFQLLD